MSEAAGDRETASAEEPAAVEQPEAAAAQPQAAGPAIITPELTEAERIEFETDMDSLHVLPLSIIPFDTPGLKRARLIKNVRLETVIEMFKDDSAGSGQVRVDEAGKLFGWPDNPSEPFRDMITLRRLAGLPSYDVYSLRVALRNIGFTVNDHSQLKLSQKKNDELTEYMRDFTRPLIQQVYADSDTNIEDVSQIIAMFQNPDKDQAMENLKKLAITLNVALPEIPKFLEDYGDIFLSLAYFKNCLDLIVPIILEFIEAMEELRQNFQLKHDRNLIDTSLFIENTLNNVTASISERFESFHRHSSAMWDDINAESFSRVKRLISSHHSTVGGVLCGLAVKMSMWNERFGKGRGGPQARADFVLSEMRHGIEKIVEVEKSAPRITAAG